MSGDKSLEEMCGAFYANCSPAQKTVIYTDYDYMKATPNETDAGAGFREFLFKAVKKADFGNLRKLFMGFPHEVTSWMLGQAGSLPVPEKRYPLCAACGACACHKCWSGGCCRHCGAIEKVPYDDYIKKNTVNKLIEPEEE